jgi:sugar/nucleoside kinase (ribokinase family)
MVGPIDVVHVGSASRDISADDPRGWRLGGGVTYAALATARLGLSTAALIGADAVTAQAPELDLLRTAGVELRIARLDEAPVFENRESPTGRVQICHATGRPIDVPDLAEAWRAAPGWSVVPVAGEIQEAWADVIPAEAYLALGWQGLLRDLRVGRVVARRAPGPSALLRRADLVGVSRNDLDRPFGDADLAPLLKAGADLLLTDGDRGGRLVRIDGDRAGLVREYRSVSARQVDPTGAGDTFLAALLASVLRPDLIGRAGDGTDLDLAFAAAAGSLAVEGVGLPAVPDLAAVQRRSAATH